MQIKESLIYNMAHGESVNSETHSNQICRSYNLVITSKTLFTWSIIIFFSIVR